MRGGGTLIMVIMGFIVAFWILAATYNPLENAVLTASNEFKGIITEDIGKANEYGELSSLLTYTPVSAVKLYAGGIYHLFWKGVTISVNGRNVTITPYPGNVSYDICANDAECDVYFAFDENGGTTTTDNKTGITGTLTSGVYWVQKRFGKSALYVGDSIDAWVQVPTAAEFNTFSKEMTLAFWAKTPDWVNKMGYYLYYWNTTEGRGWETRLQSYNTSAWFYWRVANAAYNPISDSGMNIYRDEGEPEEVIQAKTHLHDGQWHHIVLVYNSTPGKDFGMWAYVDGERWWGWMPNNDFLKVYDYQYVVGYPWGMLNNQSPFPWGCEVEANGSTIPYCEWYSQLDGANGVIKAVLDEPEDRILVAIPRWEYKPRIGGPQDINLTARIKIVSVDAAAGGGVVLRNQWWINSVSATVYRSTTIWNTTTPDWTTISWVFGDMTNDTIKTDPVVEIRGPAVVYVDWVNQWLADPNNMTILNPTMDYLMIFNDRNGGDMRFNTTMDEILIFNRTLSDAEVNELYHTPTTWNRTITAQYDRGTIADQVSDLPKLALVLLVLSIVIGLVAAASRGGR